MMDLWHHDSSIHSIFASSSICLNSSSLVTHSVLRTFVKAAAKQSA
jgi:hypothetical protein